MRDAPPWVLPASLVAVSVAAAVSMIVVAASSDGGYRCPDHLSDQACRVGSMLSTAATTAQIGGGFPIIGMAVARRESKWDSQASNNDPSEAEAACSLYNSARSTYLKNNPYGASRFCFGSGGLYGFLPATALKADGYHNADPYLIFSAPDATAMFADYVVRIVRNYFPDLPPQARNWLSIRRSMASLKTMFDWKEEGDRAGAVRVRLEEDLVSNGDDPSIMYATPSVGDYPGAIAVRKSLGSIFSNPSRRAPRLISVRRRSIAA